MVWECNVNPSTTNNNSHNFYWNNNSENNNKNIVWNHIEEKNQNQNDNQKNKQNNQNKNNNKSNHNNNKKIRRRSQYYLTSATLTKCKSTKEQEENIEASNGFNKRIRKELIRQHQPLQQQNYRCGNIIVPSSNQRFHQVSNLIPINNKSNQIARINVYYYYYYCCLCFSQQIFNLILFCWFWLLNYYSITMMNQTKHQGVRRRRRPRLKLWTQIILFMNLMIVQPTKSVVVPPTSTIFQQPQQQQPSQPQPQPEQPRPQPDMQPEQPQQDDHHSDHQHHHHRSKTLYIAGFFPTSRDIPQGSIGRGVLPAVRLALQHVNESPLFNKYRLDLVWNNTKCDAAYGMKAFFRMLDEEPVKIILFGGACPSVTDPIAKTSKFFHLIQLSYADTFTATTANFFRIVPSEGSFNPARVKLLKFFNWTKVGTIYQNLPRYSLPHSKLLTDLDNAEIEIVASQSIADELKPEMYLQNLKAKDVRIIVGNFGEEYGRKIFCQAYKEGIYGRRYQWIITGIYEENWWQLSDDESELIGCSEEQLLEAINGYISTDVLPLSKNTKTYYGFETSLYKSEYDRLRLKEYSRFHGYAYDGIWTIALAIQSVEKKLRQINSPLTIEDFQYRDPFWAQLFREALNETDFIGVTDHVSFDKNERKGIVLLQQFQSKKFSMADIAQYYTSNDELVFEDNQIDWRGGNSPPVDRNTVVIKPSRISMTLFIVISVFAICGIIIAFVFLAMNIKYRNQRYIKMSSPYLNNLIIIGCILTYTSVILLGLNSGLVSESNFPYICASRAWVLMTGFTLAFGSMFSKTWRVHAIFTDIKLNKKLIKDYKLFMVVGVLVFIDVVTLTTWQIVDPFYRVTRHGKPEPSPQNEDILVIPEMEYCQSKWMTIFLGCIYVYKGLLMAFGIFLAWETRHVSIPALNDSKYIGMSVYNVVIMCVIGAGVSFVLRDQQDAAFVILSAFIIFCSTATLCLVFVPKLIELKRNPNAGDRRVRATLKPFKNTHRDSEEVEIHTKIKLANEENFRLRQRLKEKSYELEALTFRLRALEESSNKEITDNSIGTSQIGKTSASSGGGGGQLMLVANNNKHEIIVEERDLRQIDNCDQRKLSVASLKVLSSSNIGGSKKSSRKSSVIKTPLGNFELQEETTSTSPTEIIVNSTSILSLSSEAAQLTVKNSNSSSNNTSTSDVILNNNPQESPPTNSSANGNVSSPKSDEDDDQDDDQDDDRDDDDHDHDGDDDDGEEDPNNSSRSSDEMSLTFPHHLQQQKRSVSVPTKVKKNGSPNGSLNGQTSEETSDDTSYAKAIKQTIGSEMVITRNTMVNVTNSNDQCSAVNSMTAGSIQSTIGQSVHLQHCCHHHHQQHHQHHHHHVPVTVHHHFHHPPHHHHHHMHQPAPSSSSLSSLPMSATSLVLCSSMDDPAADQPQSTTATSSSSSATTTLCRRSSENHHHHHHNRSSNYGNNNSQPTTAAASASSPGNAESRKDEILDGKTTCLVNDNNDNNDNSYDYDYGYGYDSRKERRRTQSLGGNGLLASPISFSTITATTTTAMINMNNNNKNKNNRRSILTINTSSANIHQTSTSPIRVYSSVDDTLNVVDSVDHHPHRCSSTSLSLRLYPYLNNEFYSTTNRRPPPPPEHCRSLSIDHDDHNDIGGHHHNHRHNRQNYREQTNSPTTTISSTTTNNNNTTTLRGGQSCPQVRCDIVEYL